jgi:tetratricopeptide (TPR) repeat protein
LADAYFSQMELGLITIDQGLPLARDAINKALANDPSYAPAYGRAAMIESSVERDLAAAARYLEQGLARDPANLEVLVSAVAVALRLGRLDQAIALAKYLIVRDPVNVLGHDSLAFAYLCAGRLDEAITAFRTVLMLSPGFGAEHQYLGQALLLKGDASSALAEFQQEPVEAWRLVGLAQAHYALDRKAESDVALDELIGKYEHTMAYQVAYVLAFRGEADRAFEWLDNAVEYGDTGLASIAVYPMLKNLHSDPRWLPLLRRLGMAPEQLAAIKFDVKVPQ